MNVFRSCLCKLEHNIYLPGEGSFSEELLLGSMCDATFYLWERSDRTFIASRVTNFIMFFRDTSVMVFFAFQKMMSFSLFHPLFTEQCCHYR